MVELQRRLIFAWRDIQNTLYADQRKCVNHVPINTPAVNWTSDWSFLKAVSTKFGRLKPLNPQDEKISPSNIQQKRGNHVREFICATPRRRRSCRQVLNTAQLYDCIQRRYIQPCLHRQRPRNSKQCRRIEVHVQIQRRRRGG